MSPSDYQEKRAFRRIALEMPVKYALTSAPDQFKSAMGHELSAGGMALLCDEKLVEGSEIYLVIDSDSDRYPALEATAQVHRLTTDDDGRYRISVIFQELS